MIPEVNPNINWSAFQEELNPFTYRIATGEKKIVKLADGKVVRPLWKEGDDAEFSHFYTEDWKYMWNADGTSVTSALFDMVSFVDSLDDI